jgi:transposase InsO family protein
VANCHECRRSYKLKDKTPSLLHPLPVPLHTWDDLSMDFHSPGSISNGYDNVFVVMDRLSKRHVSLPTSKSAIAKTVASLYYRYIWRFQGYPLIITSDRGPQFISDFMDELLTLTRTKLKLLTAKHAQTDGQIEIVNQIIDTRLRPFVNHF